MANSILQDLEAEYALQRQQDEAEERRRRAEATGRCPEIAEVLSGREELIFGAIRGILSGEADTDGLPERMDALNKRLACLLEANGFPADYLEPVYRCSLCRDTGYVGEPLKAMCACMRKAYDRRQYEAAGLQGGLQAGFDAFDPAVFDDREILPEVGITQRQLMLLNRKHCQAFADAYPDCETKTLVFMGKSGLGKTYLMHCVAKRLLDRGISALVVPSYRYQDAARQAMFAGNSEALDSFRAAEVLLLDDLGSEPLLNNVTVELLFALVNDRQNEGRGLAVSTNLTAEELRARYTERVASRLLGDLGKRCRLLTFAGHDLRRPAGGAQP